MKLTKRRALELSIEMWKWIAETGKLKGDYLCKQGKGRPPFNDCYLCEYTAQGVKDDFNCDLCPVQNWTKTVDGAAPCCSSGSPYNDYECYMDDANDGDDEAKQIVKESAVKIVALLEEALKNLEPAPQ